MSKKPVWLSSGCGALADFVETVGQATDPSTVPNANSICKNIPVYRYDELEKLDEGDIRAIMGEWANVLKAGSGIIVIEGLIDTDIIDRATVIFNDLIKTEKSAGHVVGDHFAKPGSNDRIWNSLEKHCIADPEGFAHYFGNRVFDAVCQSWLGPAYQVTAQVNRVNPGGQAQSAHRDYHLGFMNPDTIVKFPSHVHTVSPMLTLQGAVAHVDMPIESGPTMYLPFSQQYHEGYIAFGQPDFQEYFRQNHVQLALKKGDGVFFNPAIMHGAGNNISQDMQRLANLVQVSSAMGRAMEAVDRTRMANTLYPILKKLRENSNLTQLQIEAVVAASAEGYAFPTNLDRDPPTNGHAPKSQAEHMLKALELEMSIREFSSLLDDLEKKRRAN
ncbi:MAG: phytanoyl-CoA dioxygenase family protein [Paracoccaceae bacterium]|jgi:ectoine hydroxylase-related dioxygenase (phytanoyl-CoA dioxygenase family)